MDVSATNSHSGKTWQRQSWFPIGGLEGAAELMAQELWEEAAELRDRNSAMLAELNQVPLALL